jgi:glutathione peroxidase
MYYLSTEWECAMSFYNIKVTMIDGEEISLHAFKDKVLLIVNVASQCGFTKQYAELQQLYEKYHAQGFEVLGFPCNQFGDQEPGSEQEIKTFCKLNYHVTFPMFTKIDVNGKNTHPLFIYLKSHAKGIFRTKRIKWNFTKFLVNKHGEVIGRYAPTVKPLALSEVIESECRKIGS